MLKKLIKFLISINAFPIILTTNINVTAIENMIYYSDAVKKVNDVRSNIDTALETLTNISIGIDKYRDILNDHDDSTNFEYYKGVKPYVMYKNATNGTKHESYGPNSFYAKPCIYRLFGEEICLIPYYMTNVSAECYYVITSWAGYSWQDMAKWFTDSSVKKHHIYKSFSGEIFYIAGLSKDKKEIRLAGSMSMDKPNASIYMNLKLESSEKTKPVIEMREYIWGHTGWWEYDWQLFKGFIMYTITDESKEKLQTLKQRIASIEVKVKFEVDKLNNYNPELDRGNDDYESSNLKRILDNCEQACVKAFDFINLKDNNCWIQKF